MMWQPILIFVFTVVASTQTFLLLMGLSSLVLWFKDYVRHAFILAITTVLLSLSVTFLKNYFEFPRPITSDSLAMADGFGFPSGHATAVIFLATVVWFSGRELMNIHSLILPVSLFILVVVIGGSRVYLGVHSPVQVFAGYLLGAFWSVIFLYFASKFGK